MASEFGWEEDPADGDISRARTKLGQLRVWRFPRLGISQINGKDFAGPTHHPGLYVLVNKQKNEAYVGESIDLRKRLDEHNKSPPKELGEWTDTITLGDGRSYYQSILTENSMRQYLEKALIRLITECGALHPVNKMREEPKMSAASQTIAERLQIELRFVLAKLGLARLVSKSAVPSEEIADDKLTQLIEAKGHKVEKRKRDQIIVENCQPMFVRPGTKPRKTELGWHITLRTKPRDILNQGKGALVISRGYGYLVDSAVLKKWLGDNLWPIKPGKEAIDIYADLEQEKLYYHTDYSPLGLEPYRLTDLSKQVK